MTENFLKLISDFKTQIQEVQRTPSRICIQKTSTETYHTQTAEKSSTQIIILKKARAGKKHLIYRGAKVRIKSDFSSETM